MNRTRDRSETGPELSSSLKAWDPARECRLGMDEARTMRARVVEESRRDPHALSPRLLLASATLILAVVIGTLLLSTPAESPSIAPTRTPETSLQVQLTGQSGTRIIWTIERQGDK